MEFKADNGWVLRNGQVYYPDGLKAIGKDSTEALDVARAIEQTGSMTQTQAGLVKAQMALAGTGREA